MSQTSTRVLASIAILAALFTWRATIDLNNVRTVSGDEAIILSITERLLETGRLGTPMLEGFRGAGSHYFVVMPGQNLWQLPLVGAFGLDVAAARLLSVIAAVATILLTAALAWRWFGATEAVLSALLLVVWRSGAVDMDFGLPLLSVARSARYDITVVAWTLAAVLLCDTWIRQPAAWRAAAAGAAAGCAALTQFLGVFVIPALAVGAIAGRRPEARRFILWMLAGCAVVVMPYAVYITMHAADAAAQFSIGHSARLERGFGGLLSPLWSLLREPQRILTALRFTGFGPWLFVLGVIPAFVLASRKAQAPPSPAAGNGARLLVIVTLALLVQVALLEPTKAPVYGLVLYPFVCIAMARACTRLLAAHTPRRRMSLIAAGILALLAAEGVAVYVHDARIARTLAHYDDVGAAISAAANGPGNILGSTRWWWTLRSRGYVPFWGAEMRWEDLRRRDNIELPFDEVVRRDRIGYVLDAEDLRADAARAHPALGGPLLRVIDACGPGRQLGEFTGYGTLAVITLEEACLSTALRQDTTTAMRGPSSDPNNE